METGVWRSPVVIEMYGRPGTVIVTGTLDAALMLIGAWPTKRTEAHIAAVLCCRDVLLGQADASLARVNFIEAAIDAGYRIEPETFLSYRWEPSAGPDEPAQPALGLSELIRKRAVATSGHVTNGVPDPLDLQQAAANDQSAAILREQPAPRLRDLLGKLAILLGLISMEVMRSLAGGFGLGLFRRVDRQPQ